MKMAERRAVLVDGKHRMKAQQQVTFPGAGTYTFSGTTNSEPITVNTYSPPMVAAETVMDRTLGISETLDECLIASARIRGILFGEGEESGDKAKDQGNLSSVLYDVLTKACNLRGQLESIVVRTARGTVSKAKAN